MFGKISYVLSIQQFKTALLQEGGTMKQKYKIFYIFITMLIPLMAEEIMKITFSDDVSEETLTDLTTIIFKNNNMVAGASYKLSEILKIEFYDNGSSVDLDKKNINFKNSNFKNKNQINFFHTSTHLKLNLKKSTHLSISLYNLTGRKIADLFNDQASIGTLNLNLTKHNLANGFYSVIVKTQNSIFIKKLIIK